MAVEPNLWPVGAEQVKCRPFHGIAMPNVAKLWDAKKARSWGWGYHFRISTVFRRDLVVWFLLRKQP